LLKLMTGGLRVGLSGRLAKTAAAMMLTAAPPRRCHRARASGR
jgi:hypothetical protein